MEQQDVALLREMLREVERILDRQAAGMEHLDRKTERLLVVSVAAFAGAVALVTVLPERFPAVEPRALIIPFLPGGIANAGAVVLLFDAYLGFRTHPTVRFGPAVTWIARKARADEWSLVDHIVTLLTDAAGLEEKNAAAMRRVAKRCRAGSSTLGVAVVAHAVAYTFMLSGVA